MTTQSIISGNYCLINGKRDYNNYGNNHGGSNSNNCGPINNYTLAINSANRIEDEDGKDNTNASGRYKGTSYTDHDDSLVNGGLKFSIPVTYTGHGTLSYNVQSSVTVGGKTFNITNNNDGTFSLNTSQFQYLNNGEAIKLCISVSVSDGCKNVCSTTSVTIVGTSDNHAPCVQNVCYQDDEDGLNTVNPNDSLVNTKLVFGFSGSDVDGDSLTYSIKAGTFSDNGQSYTVATTGTAGTYTVTNAGQTFTIKDLGNGRFEMLTSEFQYLNQGQTRTLSFQYTANDGHGGTSGVAKATVTIHGTEDNHSPCVQNVCYQDDEDGLNTVNPSDTEVENHLVFSMHGSDQDAGDTLTYHILTGTFNNDGKTFTVAATATPGTYTVTNEGKTFTVIDKGNGHFEYLTSEFQYLNNGETKTLMFEYNVTDGHGGTSNTGTAKVTIYGTEDNHAPVANWIHYADDEDGDNTFNPNDTEVPNRLVFDFPVTDEDGDALTVHLVTGTYTHGGNTYILTETSTPGEYTISLGYAAWETYTVKDLGNGQFEYLTSEFQFLNNGEQRFLPLQYYVTDSHGASSLVNWAKTTIYGREDAVLISCDQTFVDDEDAIDGTGATAGGYTDLDDGLPANLQFTLSNFNYNGTGTLNFSGIPTSVTVDGHTFAITNLGNGTFKLNPSEFQYLSTGQKVEFTFNYTVSDGTLSTTSVAKVVIIGTNDNHSPCAINVSYQDDEDGLSAVNPNDTEINTKLQFSMHATDADGDVLTYTINTGTFNANGTQYTVAATATPGEYTVTEGGQTFTIKDLGNGHFEYLTSEFQYLNQGETRTLIFQYYVTDSHGAESTLSTAKVTIYGTDDNKCPVVKDVTVNEDEDASAAVVPNETLVANKLVFGFDGTDQNGDLITYHIKTGTFTSNGQDYTVAATGTPSEYTVTNNGQTFHVKDLGNGQFELLTSEFQYLNSSDIRTLKFQYEGTSAHGVSSTQTVNFDTVVTGAPGNQQWGDLKIVAKDWNGNVANAHMYEGGIGIDGGRFNTEIDHKDGSLTDSETLSIEFPSKVSSADVTLNYFYTSEQGTYEVAIWNAYDYAGNLVATGSLNAGEGESLYNGNYKYHLNLPEGTLKIVLSAGLYGGTNPNGAGGDNSDFALNAITYTTDPDCVSNTGTVTVKIHGTDDSSLVASSQTFIDDEDAIDGTGATSGAFTDQDNGLPGALQFTINNYTYTGSNPLTFSGIPASVTVDGHTYNITNNGNGTFSVNKADFQHLSVGERVEFTFNYTVTDGSLSATAAAKVVIIGTNDGIDAVDDQLGTLGLGEDITLINGGILANDTDTDGDDLDVASINSLVINGVTIPQAQWAQYFTVNNETGEFNFTSVNMNVPAGTTQNVVINYTATDPYGATDSANIYVAVRGPNVTLVASNQTFVDDEDAVDGTGATSGAFTDQDNGIPGTLQFTINNFTYNGSNPPITFSGIPATALGSDGNTYNITNNGNGTFTVNKADFQGLSVGERVELTFNYTVSDGTLSATAAAKVVIIGTNDGIDAVDDNAGTINDGDSVTIPVLANDTDTDGDDLDVASINSLVINGVTIPQAQWAQYFTVNNETGQLVFNSANMNVPAGTTQNVVINYTATDPYGSTDSANVYVAVRGPQVHIDAADQQFVDDEDAIDGTSATSGAFTDQDNGIPGTLKFQITAPQYNGSGTVTYSGIPTSVTVDGHTYAITNNGNGAFTLDKAQFQHLAVGERVEFTFNYTVTDGTLTDTAQTKVVIIGTNDGPDAVNDIVGTINEGATVTVNVLGNDSDPDGDPITVTKVWSITIDGTLISDPAQVAQYVTILPNGQLFINTSSIPDKDHNYGIVVNYEISDPYGLKDRADVFLNVNNVDKVIYYGDSGNGGMSLITTPAVANDSTVITSGTISNQTKDYANNTVVLDHADAYGDFGTFKVSVTAGNATAVATPLLDGGTEFALANTDATIKNNTFNFGDDTITVNRGLIVGDTGTLTLFGHQGNASANYDPDCFSPFAKATANVAINGNTFNFGDDTLKIGNGDVIGDVQKLEFTYENGTATGNGILNDNDTWNFGNTFNFGNDNISAREGTLTGDLATAVVNGVTYDLSVASRLADFQATSAYTNNTFHFGHDTFVFNSNEPLNVKITDFGIGGVHDTLKVTGLSDVNGGGLDLSDLIARSEVVNDGAGHIKLALDINNDGIVDGNISFTNITFVAGHHEITDYLSASDIIASA